MHTLLQKDFFQLFIAQQQDSDMTYEPSIAIEVEENSKH